MTETDWTTATAILRLSAQLVDGISAGMAERGFSDVRPVHGFLFAELSAGPATATELAAALEITKQAAAQLIAYLTDRGYLRKEPDPDDRRAQLVALTPRGQACTVAARESAEQCVQHWRKKLSAKEFRSLMAMLDTIAVPGRLKPSW
jgi:DNA-binding MarR family transcriptional regulator